MYPTIYHFILDNFGLDIPMLKIMNSFGFFVAMAFVSAAYFLKLELDRKTKEGHIPKSFKKVTRGQKPGWYNMVSSAVMGFVIGFKFVPMLLNSDGALADPQGFLLSSQGNVVAGALFSFIFLGLLYWEFQKEKKEYPTPITEDVAITSTEHSWNMAMYAAVFGFTGAKLFHLIENPDQFVAFFNNFDISQILSGLTIYGGLILGGAGVMWYLKQHNIPIFRGADAVVPGLMLAYGIGRIGCQVSGDGDWGIDNIAPKPSWMNWLPDWMWSYNYPNNVNGVGVPITDGTCFDGYCTQLPVGVFPTPFYETVMAVTIFLILWSLRKRISTPGVLFFTYMIFNGIERFWIEKIRINNDFLTVGGWTMTQAELISMLLFVVGIVGIILLKRQRAKG